MKNLYLPFILFFLLALEGVAQEFLPNSLVYGSWLIIPHFVLIYLILIAVFYDNENTYYAVLYGIIFGMMKDIVYTDILGIYMFIYAFTVYLTHGAKKFLHGNFFVAAILTAGAVGIADIGLHIIYSFIEGNSIGFNEFLIRRLLPSILANLVFFLIVYPLVKNNLTQLGIKKTRKNSTVS